MKWTGGCLCGAVRYMANGEPALLRHCHCKMCQRASGSPFMTGVVFPEAAVNWLQGDRAFYQSSMDYRRSFCPNCGGCLTHEGEGKVWLYVGSMDKPEALAMHPPRDLDAEHIFVSEQIPWIRLEDDVPRYAEFPPYGRPQI